MSTCLRGRPNEGKTRYNRHDYRKSNVCAKCGHIRPEKNKDRQ